MQPGKVAYDRASIIFSPNGRLFQVEYARDAVKKGSTIIGLKFKDGVTLIVDKRIISSLIVPDSVEKIFQIDDHIGCATSGLVADARTLVDRVRLYAQINEIRYNEKIPLLTLVKRICDFEQTYTQYATVRPFGIALLIAGVDETGPHLFATDPSGAFVEYKACSEGAGRSEAIAYFDGAYKEHPSADKAICLGIKALHQSIKGKLNPDAVEIAVIDIDEKFRKLSHDETENYVKKAIG